MRILLTACAVAALAACDQNQSSVSIGQPSKPTAAKTAAAKPIASLPRKAPATKAAALKLMHDRHEDMEKIRDAFRDSGRTLKTANPDLAVIRKSAATMARLAPQIPSWFPPGTGPDVGKTEAKAAIWQTPQDFAAKAHAFNTLVQAFNGAAKAGDMSALKAGAADLGKSCKACHDLYREEH